MKVRHSITLALLMLFVPATARAATLAGPITNSANGHLYYLLTTNTWSNSQVEARALGGHLVTINDFAENQWILETFFPLTGVPYASLWIGLNDAASEGQFVWASGQPVTFTYWYPGEPNNAGGGEDYATLRHPSTAPPVGSWNDLSGFGEPSNPLFGVVEIEAPPMLKIYPAVELEFSTAVGQCFQIEYSSNLVTWLPLTGAAVATSNNYTLLVSTRNTAARFFRLATGETAPGLVASYHFDGSAVDCSPNGNHGITFNVTPATNRFGTPNAAYRFAGTNDSYIRVPDSASLRITNAITLGAWINFEGGGTGLFRILHKEAYDLAIGDSGQTTRRLHFTIKGTAQIVLSSPTEILQTSRWHFVVGTYDGALMLLYVDGSLVASTVVSTRLETNNLDLNIGRNAQTSGDNYRGLIDDLQIYSRALSSSEVTALFNERD